MRDFFATISRVLVSHLKLRNLGFFGLNASETYRFPPKLDGIDFPFGQSKYFPLKT
tara:strand:+ start:336 stop:503 length:168 start_codon:yes stop_codon:yes gene_type:complete